MYIAEILSILAKYYIVEQTLHCSSSVTRPKPMSAECPGFNSQRSQSFVLVTQSHNITVLNASSQQCHCEIFNR